MRMRRKKHLDERLADCRELYLNLRVDTVRFDADEAPKHLNFRELFGNDNPVELEIGCGKGGFICELAAIPRLTFWRWNCMPTCWSPPAKRHRTAV